MDKAVLPIMKINTINIKKFGKSDLSNYPIITPIEIAGIEIIKILKSIYGKSLFLFF